MAQYPHHQLSPSTGAMLREVRKSKGWTLVRAAGLIGCDFSYLSLLERALRAPSKSLALDIAYAYGLPRDQAQVLLAESVDGVGRSKKRKKAAA